MAALILLASLAAVAVGTVAVVAARRLWQWIVLFTLALYAFAMVSVLGVRLMVWAKAAANPTPARYDPAYQRWVRVWEAISLWSILDMLACVLCGVVLGIAAIIALANAAIHSDLTAGTRRRGNWLVRHALWIVLAHAVLTAVQGFLTFFWMAPYLPGF